MIPGKPGYDTMRLTQLTYDHGVLCISCVIIPDSRLTFLVPSLLYRRKTLGDHESLPTA